MTLVPISSYLLLLSCPSNHKYGLPLIIESPFILLRNMDGYRSDLSLMRILPFRAKITMGQSRGH